VARTQVEIQNNLKYHSGQSVQPIFEGWSRTPDGGFNMHFGYLNRNYVQDPHIPIGPANSIEPGGPDRGQPTYFYTRTNRNLFTVAVPKDWGKKELVWTLTVNGKTDRAIGWLQPEWEIDPAGGAQFGGRVDPNLANNKPPTIAIDPRSPITLPATAVLTASIADDGLPKPTPQKKPAVGQESPPILQGGPDAPVNVPEVASVSARTQRQNRPQGMSVSWIVWRGPGAVAFEPRNARPKDGKATTTATFMKPGEYVLRARASDSALTTQRDLKIVVNGPSSSNQP
jgi:hypothetical protein